MAMDGAAGSEKIVPIGLGVSAARADNDYRLILQNLLLIGQNVGMKGYLVRIRDEALADVKSKRKKRDEADRFVDDFASFIALQQSIAGSLSVLSKNLDHKIEVLETAIEHLKGKSGSEQTVKILKHLKEDAELQRESVVRAVNRLDKAQDIEDLEEIQTGIKKKQSMFDSLQDRFSEWRKAKASFDYEAYVRPEIKEETDHTAFYESMYADLTSGPDKEPDETPQDNAV
jgi:CHASE3 domain sensor protein